MIKYGDCCWWSASSRSLLSKDFLSGKNDWLKWTQLRNITFGEGFFQDCVKRAEILCVLPTDSCRTFDGDEVPKTLEVSTNPCWSPRISSDYVYIYIYWKIYIYILIDIYIYIVPSLANTSWGAMFGWYVFGSKTSAQGAWKPRVYARWLHFKCLGPYYHNVAKYQSVCTPPQRK